MTYLSWKKHNNGISPDHSKLEHLKRQQKKIDMYGYKKQNQSVLYVHALKRK